METKYQTSFIPQKTSITSGQNESSSLSLFLVVSIVVFLISLGLAGYVYLEKKILVQKITADQGTIETNKNGLISDSNTVENLVALNSRINVAKNLLNKHVSISPIFDFLQQTTLKSVRFKNFSFSSTNKDTSGSGGVFVQMSGSAKDWETVASQADEFGKADWKKAISEPKVSNLSLNIDGSVSFVFSAYVLPDFLVFDNSPTNN